MGLAMSLERFQRRIGGASLKKAEATWFPRWVDGYRQHCQLNAQSDLPISETLVIGFLRSLRDNRIAAWRRLQAARAIELYQEIIPAAQQIISRAKGVESVEILRTIPGVGYYSALALACRVGDPSRFPKGKSLAHYWGLTPGVNDSGEGTGRRGRITKAGSTVARWMLAQITLHVLRRDPVMKAWYKPIKNRRGSKIARVAVMRRLAVIIRNMLVNKQDYFECRDAMTERRKTATATKKKSA